MKIFSDFFLSIVFGYMVASVPALPVIFLGGLSQDRPPFWLWSFFALPISLLAFLAMRKGR